MTARASNAAWKNEMVCNHRKAGVTESRLISNPVNRRLEHRTVRNNIRRLAGVLSHLNNMIKVPTRLATLILANAMESSSTTLAVVRLNITSVSINFQKAGTVGTSPTRPYTIPPNIRGGTSRSGRMSNRIYSKAVNTYVPVVTMIAHLGRKVGEGRVIAVRPAVRLVPCRFFWNSALPLSHEEDPFICKQSKT